MGTKLNEREMGEEGGEVSSQLGSFEERMTELTSSRK